MELGYMSGETSTFYGEATKAAVLKYQKAVGLEENGIMDAAALEGLYAESAPKAVRVEDLADATAFLCNLAVDTTGQDVYKRQAFRTVFSRDKKRVKPALPCVYGHGQHTANRPQLAA